jgi:hypothetical protein
VGLRETLNENPGLTTAGTVLIVVAAIVFIVVSWARGPVEGEGVGGNQAYYTIDDGQNYFAAEFTKIPPFEHEGKQAVRAHVFTCDGGKTRFVGYLERFSPEAKKMVEEFARQTGSSTMAMEDQSGIQVKRPGTGERGWVSMTHPTAQEIRNVLCPDGTTIPEPVMP